jgi:hypothetical protein
MLWALVSSAYVIFLYRKLKAEAEPLAGAPTGQPAGIDAALETLDQRLAALEGRLAGREKEPVR